MRLSEIQQKIEKGMQEIAGMIQLSEEDKEKKDLCSPKKMSEDDKEEKKEEKDEEKKLSAKKGGKKLNEKEDEEKKDLAEEDEEESKKDEKDFSSKFAEASKDIEGRLDDLENGHKRILDGLEELKKSFKGEK